MVLYHAITPRGVYPVLDSNADVVHPDVFQQHLKWISRFYDFAPLSDVVTAIKTNSPERLAAITFDDGYRCVAEYAVPVLSAKKVPFTIFLISDVAKGEPLWRDGIRVIMSSGEEQKFLDHLRNSGYQPPDAGGALYRWSKSALAGNSSELAAVVQSYLVQAGLRGSLDGLYLEPGEIRELASAGALFGNHTSGHHVLATLSINEQRDAISKGASALSETVGIDRDVLSLPFGGELDWNTDTLQAAAESGYSTVLSTITKKPRTMNHPTNHGQVLEIRRATGSGNVRGMFRSIRGR